MPVMKGALTLYIVRNIQDLIRKYNQSYPAYIHDYQGFIRERSRLLGVHEGDFVKLLHDLTFTNELLGILTKFGMNARAAELVHPQQFLETVSNCGSDFELLNTAQIRLHV